MTKPMRHADAKEGEFPCLCINIAGHLLPGSKYYRRENALAMPFGLEISFACEGQTPSGRAVPLCRPPSEIDDLLVGALR